MSDTQTTIIGGFTAELYPLEDDRMGCDVTKGNAGSSLEVADDTGELYNGDNDPVVIPQRVIDRIRTWAETYGY